MKTKNMMMAHTNLNKNNRQHASLVSKFMHKAIFDVGNFYVRSISNKTRHKSSASVEDPSTIRKIRIGNNMPAR